MSEIGHDMTRETAERKLRLVPGLDMEHPFIVEVLEGIDALDWAVGTAVADVKRFTRMRRQDYFLPASESREEKEPGP